MEDFRKWPLAERISLIVQILAFAISLGIIFAKALISAENNPIDFCLTKSLEISVFAATVMDEPIQTEKETTTTTHATSTVTTTTTVAAVAQTEEMTESEKESESTTSATENEAHETIDVSANIQKEENFSQPERNVSPVAENPIAVATTIVTTTNQTPLTTMKQTTIATTVATTQVAQEEDNPQDEPASTETEDAEDSDSNNGPKKIATTLEEVDAMPLTGQVGSAYPVTKSEFILLCNLLGREYGANWVSEEEKAKVIECVMNRVYSSQFPNTVRGVLGQRNQFTGSLALGDSAYRRNVTTSVKLATLNYLNGMYKNHGYRFYWGDGWRNHFRINY